MKKNFISLFLILLFCATSYASCPVDKDFPMLDDDEYCIYNQCYFDKQYRKMKKDFYFTDIQEEKSDKIYKKFKSDMEKLRFKYQQEREKLLDMIVRGVDLEKEQAKYLDGIDKEIKNRRKTYVKELKTIIKKENMKEFNKFLKHQEKIAKKVLKYGKVYKFPCCNCLR